MIRKSPRRVARGVLKRARRQWRRRRTEYVRHSYARRATANPAAALALGDRLVTSPVFVLSSIRSGSTLLRSVLDAHPEIIAPHEMHLGELQLNTPKPSVARAYRHLGYDAEELLNLLWDRVLHQQLLRSDKSVIVDKTPKNTFEWERIQRSWPAAKFIVLLRHPEQILQSMQSARPDISTARHMKLVNTYVATLDEARAALSCVVVRYEEFTRDPEGETKRICEYLGVPWDARMLDYGRTGVRYRRGLGDWSDNIRTGKIQPAAPLPALADVPPQLRDAVALLGY